MYQINIVEKIESELNRLQIDVNVDQELRDACDGSVMVKISDDFDFDWYNASKVLSVLSNLPSLCSDNIWTVLEDCF